MKKPVMISGACILVTALLLFWGFGQTEPNAETPKASYALVVEDDTGTFVMQLRKGMQAAADGASVSILNAADTEPRGGYQAIFLLADALPSAFKGLPILYINRIVSGNYCVRTDDEGAALALLERALEMAPAGEVVLICDGADGRSAVRSAWARRFANANQITVLTYAPNALHLPETCTVAVAMSSRVTSVLAAMRRESTFGGTVLGIDTGDMRSNDLEDGSVTVMALDNPYAMGYLAMVQMLEGISSFALTGGASAPDPISVGVLLADQSNMYLPENVKQVFPLLQ